MERLRVLPLAHRHDALLLAARLWSLRLASATAAMTLLLYPVLFFHVCQKLVRWAAGYGSGLEQTSCTSECCRVEPADLAPTLL